MLGSGAPELLLVPGSGSPELLLALPTVVSPLPDPSVPLAVPDPSVAVEVGGGPCDTAPGEQSHSPNPLPSAAHVRSPSSSSHGHGCVSPGTHGHGGTSGGPPLVLFISSAEPPEQASASTSAHAPSTRPAISLPSWPMPELTNAGARG